MYDESWCAGCGVGIHYTEDESAMCHNCNEEGYVELETRSSKFMEYLKAYLNSLEQDLESIYNQMESLDPNCKEFGELDFDYNIKSGEITATRHLLSVATDIMNSSNERYE
jgi:hypothetical protein